MTTPQHDPSTLPVDGWRYLDEFLPSNPDVAKLIKTESALRWLVRQHKDDLAPFAARQGRRFRLHDQARDTLLRLALRPVGGEDA